MLRRIAVFILLATLAFTVACTNKKVNNPLANVGSKQPDKVLFDRAMDAVKHNRFDVARITLQTLINTYPDSEYIARAKLAVADSWYAEGGSTSLAQAEAEYKDFETFFPNRPEAAEAQVKIANIHYQQMEKPDRDFTHAMRTDDAKARLQALHQPIPRPTKQAIALNKREEESRRETPMYKQVIRNFSKRPDTEQAAKGGDPTLVDPPMTSATEVVQQATRAMMGTGGGADKNAVAIETVGNGAPPPSQPAPRSDAPPSDNAGAQPENSAAPPAEQPANELKPNVATDSY